MATPTYRILTWNARYDEPTDLGNTLAERLPLIADAITREAPDLIGFQEVLPESMPALEAILDGYILVGRPRDAACTDETTPVAIRLSRFRLLEATTRWLSPTPDVPGSRYPDQSICPRTYVVVTVQDRVTGHRFTFVNTHYDHASGPARTEAQAQLFAVLDQLHADPHSQALIVGGDLNLTPDDSLYAAWAARGYTDLTADTGPTFHNYGRMTPGIKIDYLLAPSDDWVVTEAARPLTDQRDQTYLSDHYPIAVTVAPAHFQD